MYPCHKGLKRFEMTGLHGLQPGIKVFSCALTYHLQKRFDQLIGGFQVWVCLSQPLERLQFFSFQLFLLAEKEPGGLLCGESQQWVGQMRG